MGLEDQSTGYLLSSEDVLWRKQDLAQGVNRATFYQLKRDFDLDLSLPVLQEVEYLGKGDAYNISYK